MTDPTLADLHDEATWLEWRSQAVPALHQTELVTTDQTRAEFLEGARLLRLDQPSRARYTGAIGPTPIQLVIADTLNAGHFLSAILEPRRAAKTTSIEAVILGRCTFREDYIVGWTLATLGAKASERFRKDIVVHVERLYPDPRQRPFKVNVGKGTEHLEWKGNGSFLNVYAPSGDGFRSGGFDLAWVDEAGEAELDLSEDLTVAVLPTMDTKPGAQFVVSGTAAKYRGGNLLWDTLEDESAGVLRHAIPDTTDPEELEAWEPDEDHPRARVRELVELYHPGVGHSTPLEAVARNFAKFPREKFNAEYLGVFGSEGSNIGLIPPAQWERTAKPGDLPAPPKRFAMAMSIHPDGLWASIGVAWRFDELDDDLVAEAFRLDGQHVAEPKIGVGLLHHQDGTKGLANKALAFARKYRVPIIYDQLSQAAGVEVETLSRAVPRPTLMPATTVDVRRSATKLLKALTPDEDHIRHWRQPRLDTAVEIAVKRAIGTAGGFGFGRPKGDPAADITPVEAISLALHFIDEQPHETSPADSLHF